MQLSLRKDLRCLQHQEQLFHDQWAEDTDLRGINVRESFEGPTAPENRFILQQMGSLHGKRVLDIGAGLGESSVYLALQGARVTAVDLSPGMVDFARRLARHHGVRIEGKVAPAESLNVDRHSYDFVYVANTIHHLPDPDSMFSQIRLALRPGGRFFAIEPLAYNPVINVYRRMATMVRTRDEKPVTFDLLQAARRHFATVHHREFWIATLALFLKYYLLNGIHPNSDRYWKRILRESPGGLWWWYPLRALDALLTRLPAVRRLAWNIVLWGETLATEPAAERQGAASTLPCLDVCLDDDTSLDRRARPEAHGPDARDGQLVAAPSGEDDAS